MMLRKLDIHIQKHKIKPTYITMHKTNTKGSQALL